MVLLWFEFLVRDLLSFSMSGYVALQGTTCLAAMSVIKLISRYISHCIRHISAYDPMSSPDSVISVIWTLTGKWHKGAFVAFFIGFC